MFIDSVFFSLKDWLLGIQKAHCIGVSKEAYSPASFNANCQGKIKDMTYHCHQDVCILSLNSYASNWTMFFALIPHHHFQPKAFCDSVINWVIFWPGLQVPIKFPFLQKNYAPVNHHHSLPLLLPARLWLLGPQQIQYHWFPLMAAAVMMTSGKHWDWQKILK